MTLPEFLLAFEEAARIVPHQPLPIPQLRYLVTRREISGLHHTHRFDPVTLTHFHRTGVGFSILNTTLAGELLGLPFETALSLAEAAEDPASWERWPLTERVRAGLLRDLLVRVYAHSGRGYL